MQRWMRGPKRRGQGMQGRRFASMNRARARCTLLDASENKCRFVPARGSTHRSHQFAFRRSRFSRNGSLLPSHNTMHRAQRLGNRAIVEPNVRQQQSHAETSPHHPNERTTQTIDRGTKVESDGTDPSLPSIHPPIIVGGWRDDMQDAFVYAWAYSCGSRHARQTHLYRSMEQFWCPSSDRHEPRFSPASHTCTRRLWQMATARLVS